MTAVPSPAATSNGPSDFATAYALARKHSARVRRLKFLLPLVALAISTVFGVVSLVRTWLPDNITIEGAHIEDGKVVMEKPAINGRNSDGASYAMSAEKALQDITDPNSITLRNIIASLPVNADTLARIIATEGLYNRSRNTLDMTEPFTIALSSGLEASFRSAALDIQAGKMETQEPVSIRTTQASIVAQRMKMTDKGKTITFTGKVRVNLDSAAIHQEGK